MNRRGFLTALAGAIASFELDPERLLWRRGAKLISIPIPMPTHLSVRWIRAFDTVEDEYVSRYDVLYGWGKELQQSGVDLMAGSPADLQHMDKTQREVIECALQNRIQPRIGSVLLEFPPEPEMRLRYSEIHDLGFPPVASGF